VAEAQATVHRLMAVDWDWSREPLRSASPSVIPRARKRPRDPQSRSPLSNPSACCCCPPIPRRHLAPHALALAEWLPKAVKAAKAVKSLSPLKSADKWLKEAADAIRNERFAPIADQTKTIWDQLKLQSNVRLEPSTSAVPARPQGRAQRHRRRPGRRRPRRHEPGRAPLPRPQPLHPAGHPPREPFASSPSTTPSSPWTPRESTASPASSKPRARPAGDRLHPRTTASPRPSAASTSTRR